jgi:hypothetical protein
LKAIHEGRGRPKKEKQIDKDDENYSQMLADLPHHQCFEISGFCFLADDTKLVVVQFKPQDVAV